MLHIEGITKHFDQQPVLRGISLDMDQGDILCLLGPSGCGKTTLLRIIAGLENADSGTIMLKGKNIIETPVHKRGFGLMFQDFALFPHMSVADNIAFGLEMQKLSRADTQMRVSQVLKLVGLTGLADRSVTELSGGEQQRVGLARSLAPQPDLLMLDEPLGSLDAALRERLMIELREIIKGAGVTAIYVTHDQQEAFAIADYVAVMNAGQIEQISPPEELYHCPETAFVAEFLGFKNMLPILHTESANKGFIAQTVLGDFVIPKLADRILLHPAYLRLVEADKNAFRLRVEKRIFRGGTFQIVLRHDENLALTMEIPSTGVAIPVEGESVFVQTAAEGVIPLRG